jgi:excisionase family DNA binding protein
MKTVGASEAADCLNVSVSHVLRLLDKGEIRFTKVGNRPRIKKSDLEDYRKRLKSIQQKQLKFLSKQAQELSLGYSIQSS